MADSLLCVHVPVAPSGFYPGVTGQQLFFGLAVALEFDQARAEVASASLDPPVLWHERLLIDVNRLPLRFLGLSVLALEIQQDRQIVQIVAHRWMLIPQQLALHRQRLTAQGSGFL